MNFTTRGEHAPQVPPWASAMLLKSKSVGGCKKGLIGPLQGSVQRQYASLLVRRDLLTRLQPEKGMRLAERVESMTLLKRCGEKDPIS